MPCGSTPGRRSRFWHGDLRDYGLVERIFREFEPEAVIHLGECPSAPYSMIDREHTTFVQINNLTTTFNLMFAMRDIAPSAHLLKLGTMGEYGTPNVDIPEGFFEVEYRGRKRLMPFPRQAPSWYHWSKVHGSNNMMFACKIWGIRATDVMQGVVFGTRVDGMGDDPRLRTRLDFDQAFGTAINRFSCQAVIEHPLTPYGDGGQVRGFLPLRDSMQCLTLGLENPPEPGEYRVFNQFEETYSIRGWLTSCSGRRWAGSQGARCLRSRTRGRRSSARSITSRPTTDGSATSATSRRRTWPAKCGRCWRICCPTGSGSRNTSRRSCLTCTGAVGASKWTTSRRTGRTTGSVLGTRSQCGASTLPRRKCPHMYRLEVLG